jgi:PAS domain S-box-containing protein
LKNFILNAVKVTGQRLKEKGKVQALAGCSNAVFMLHMGKPTQVGPPKSSLMRVRRKEEKAPRNSTRTVATANLRRGHTGNGIVRRTQNEKVLQAEVADLEAAKAELGRQNEELMANRATLEFERGRYEELFNFAPDGYVVTDLKGRIQHANVAACRLLNREEQSLVGFSFAQCFAREDRHKLYELPLAKPDPTKKAERVEATLLSPNGAEPIPCALRVNAISDARGVVIGLRWSIRDITERKRGEERQAKLLELVETVNRAKALPEIYEAAVGAICKCLGTSRASILVYDDDNVMRFKFARGLSLEYRQAVEGHSPWKPDEPNPQAITIEDVAKVTLEDQFRKAFRLERIRSLAFIPLVYEGRLLGKFMVYYEAPHHFTEEELRLGHAIAGPVSYAVERKKSALALAEAKRQLEEHTKNLERAVAERTAKLRESIEELESFSYSLSHDMRAPLRAITSFSELLELRFGNQLGQEGKELLDRVISSAGRLDRLIRDVLAYSQVTLAPIEKKPLDPEKLIRQIIEEHPAFQEPKAEIEIRTPLLTFLGQEAALTQCVYNLLSNAIKFVPKGTKPHIQIWTEPFENYVRLWVDDNGIGIPAEAKDRMFLMFQRFHRSAEYEGTGIGLAIVRKAVDRMGGKVGVESEPGRGSRFWLLLPSK